MPCPLLASADDGAAQLVARRGALIELARGLDERHRLVQLERVLLLWADLERSRTVSRTSPLPALPPQLPPAAAVPQQGELLASPLAPRPDAAGFRWKT